MNVINTRGHCDFRTRYLTFFFNERYVTISALGLCVNARWAEVYLDAIDDGGILRVSNAMAFLTSEEYLFLKPLLERYKEEAKR
jgi:hypothetical protein